MKFTIKEINSEITQITLDGRMDADGVMLIEKPLAELGSSGKNVIIDMCRVEYMASLGIRKLLQTAKAAMHCGKKIAIVNPQSLVLGVFKTANIDSVIALCQSEDAAEKYFKGRA